MFIFVFWGFYFLMSLCFNKENAVRGSQLMEVKEEAVCRVRMKVRWGDCDPAGIVYYPRYFEWFTDGRTELFRQAGLSYGEIFHKQGIELVVIEASCRYKYSLQPEEEVIIETRLAGLTRSRLEFKYRVLKEENAVLAGEGRTVHTYVNNAGKPFDAKKKYPALWAELERSFGLGR